MCLRKVWENKVIFSRTYPIFVLPISKTIRIWKSFANIFEIALCVHFGNFKRKKAIEHIFTFRFEKKCLVILLLKIIELCLESLDIFKNWMGLQLSKAVHSKVIPISDTYLSVFFRKILPVNHYKKTIYPDPRWRDWRERTYADKSI